MIIEKRFHGYSLYRLEYLPAILVPILIALIDSKNKNLALIVPILGWILFAISINLMNDFFDKDRILDLGRRPILYLSFLTMAIGFYFIWDHSLFFGLIYILLMSAYNIGLKRVPILENFIQVFAYCVVPYLAFVINPKISTLLILIFAGIVAELAHHIADKDSTFKFLKTKVSVWCSLLMSSCFFFACIYYVWSSDNKYYWPAILIAIEGVIYSTQTLLGFKQIEEWVEVKRFGVEMMKFGTLYLLVILLFKVL